MIARLSLAFILLTSGSFAHAETIRDYYDEPSLNPLKESLDFNAEEAVDPFSGGLRIAHQDLVIPGNGGMDIVINRIYNSPNNSVGERSVVGVGWTMHFGRVVMNEGDEDKVCNQGLWSVSVGDNPSFETPDGGRELLVYADDPNAYLITRNRWKLDCIVNGSQQDIVVTSPSGTRYFANHRIFGAYYVNKIVDVRGNTLDLAYATNPNGIPYLQQIDASDGRRVVFEYTDASNDQILLDKIRFDGKIWDYNYQDVANVAGGDEYLVEVILPTGTRWQYDYYPMLTGIGEHGSFAMKTFTYPWSGRIEYTYDQVYFDPTAAGAAYPTTVVKTRTVTNSAAGSSVSGTWTFDYSPAFNNADAADITTVTAPDGTHKYYHYGWSGVIGGQLWNVGLRAFEEHFDTSGTLVKQVRNTWDYQVISQEDYRRGRDLNKVDHMYAAPILVKREIWQDGANYITDYLNHDAYGNPAQIVETGNLDSRTTDLVYRNDTTSWILGLTKSETLQGVGNISRSFNGYGELETLNEYGVVTTFTYTGSGDLASETDARGFSTEYADYHRGTPQIERYEVQPGQFLQYQRVVNNDGTVRSETNPRNYTYSYGYDALGRVTSITPPTNQQVTIDYVDGGSLGRTCQMTVTRGTSQHQMTCDGFGRRVEERSTDTLTGESIVQSWERDVIGRVTFASYPNSSDGTQFDLDGLGRVVKETYPDLTSVTYDYDAITATSNVMMTNERGFTTKYLYRAYGNPDDKQLVSITSPELIRTYMTKDASGRLLSVWQGEEGGRGYERVYGYNANKFLTSIDEPEVGITTFGRDAVGNLASYQVETSGITSYTRDGLGRITLVDYPNTTPDVTVTYNPNGSLETVANSVSTRTYTYDPNENLTLEQIEIEGSTYEIGYRYNLLDQVDTLVYPSGRDVGFVPDALGRPRAAYPYVTDASYHPTGAVSQMVYANGQVTNIGLDNRLRVKTMQVGNGSPLVDLDYTYDPAGNVEAISDAVDPLQNRNFGYDADNRLTVANGIWGTGSMAYDFQNNITQMTLGSRSIDYTYQNNLLIKYVGDSRVTLDYDIYRNVTYNGRGTYLFDDAGNLVKEEPWGTVLSTEDTPRFYAYDGNGMRVRKQWDTTQTLGNKLHYVYTKGGQLIGEYKTNSVSAKEYVYLGSSLVASVDGLIPPTADAGVDQTAKEGVSVTLDGTDSAAYYGTISYQWVQTGGPSVALTGANTATPSFTAPTQHQGVTLTFSLTVTDSYNQSTSDTVTITVPMLDTDVDGISDNWELAYFGSLSQSSVTDLDHDGYSDLQEFELGLDPTVAQPLDVVDGLYATPGNGEVALRWNPVDRAISYDVYWSLEPGVTPVTGNKIAGVTTPYVHTSLDNGVIVYYVVQANNDCCSSISSEVAATPGRSGWGVASTLYTGDISSSNHDYAYNSNGEQILVFEDTKNAIKALIYDASTGWLEPLTVYDASNNYPRNVAVDINDAGQVMVAWSRSAPTPTYGDLIQARFYDPSTGWGSVTTIADYTASDSSVSSSISSLDLVDALGDFVVAWDQYRPSPDDLSQRIRKVHARRYVPANGWGDVITVAHDAEIMQALAASETGHIAVASTQVGTAVDDAILYVTRYDPAIGWGAKEPVLGSGNAVNDGFDAYNLAVASDGQVAIMTDSYSDGPLVDRYIPGIGWSGVIPLLDDGVVDESGFLDSFWSNTELYFTTSGELHAAMVEYQIEAGMCSGELVSIANFDAPDGPVRNVVDFPGYARALGVARPSNDAVAMLVQTGDCNGGYEVSSYSGASQASMRPAEVVASESVYGWPGLIYAGSDVTGNISALWLSATGIREARYTVISGAPVAVAGANQDHYLENLAGTDIVLDGSSSTDPDDDIASYQWTQISGPSVSLTGSDAASATFSPPGLAEGELAQLVFQLEVTDLSGMTSSDTVRIDLHGANIPPVLGNLDLSGPYRTDRVAPKGTEIRIGSYVTDADGYVGPEGGWQQYLNGQVRWRQTSGTSGTFVQDDNFAGKFVTPIVSVDTPVTLEMTYIDHAGESVSGIVNFTVLANYPPRAYATYSQTGNEIELRGSGSSDVDGQIVSYQWVQTAGPTVNLLDPTASNTTFVSPNVDATLSFELTVTDDGGKTGTDIVNVPVTDSGPPTTTSTVTTSTSKGKTYYDIALSSNEPGETYYRISGDGAIVGGGLNTVEWQVYGIPVTYEIKSGTATLYYYSIDAAGNQESIQTEVLQ